MKIEILDLVINDLEIDYLQHGWLVQTLSSSGDDKPSKGQIMNLLANVLATGKAEIGNLRQLHSKRVEFVGWRGTVDEKIERAMNLVEHLQSHQDKINAYYIAKPTAVDRYEDYQDSLDLDL